MGKHHGLPCLFFAVLNSAALAEVYKTHLNTTKLHNMVRPRIVGGQNADRGEYGFFGKHVREDMFVGVKSSISRHLST